MGVQNVVLPKTKKDEQEFVKYLLRDTQALEKMLMEQLFETDTIRIGAEQEFNLIDDHYKPSCTNLEVLEKLKNPLFTTELARFNMECNIDPVEFKGKCLSKVEKQIIQLLGKARKVAQGFGDDIILTGILPTIRKSDVNLDNITPVPRYDALMNAILKMRNEGSMSLNIEGVDEMRTKHSSPMVESSNTGFQVHLQVKPDEFAARYNIAQAICGPALAMAVNSPLLFGKRLWHETRIALFQQAVDTRTAHIHLRDRSPRVMFGNKWVTKSILEIYKEDIMRFRVLLSATDYEDSLKTVIDGGIPSLFALLVHNSTVYRWNRPCYGVAGGVAHLRIENRVLPAGPTVVDEMANAALWLGLLNGMGDHYPDITQRMEFDDAKDNFFKACRQGMDTSFTWVDERKISAKELMLKELIPIAKEGLLKNKVDKDDVNRYFEILEERASTGKTGASWMLNSYNKIAKKHSKDEAILAVTACTLQHQKTEMPAHTWPLASVENLEGSEYTTLTVESFMTTDLLTVFKDDILDLAAEMMNTQRLRYIPVEDEDGCLVGLLTSSLLMRHYNRNYFWDSKDTPLVKDVMISNPLTITGSEPIRAALELMQENNIGSLPVVEGDDRTLMGIIMEQDFLKITGRLLKQKQKHNKKKK